MLSVLGLFIIIPLLLLLLLVFEVWMFVDAIRNPRLTDTQRVLWCVGMLLVHPFVAIAYYFIEYPKQRPGV